MIEKEERSFNELYDRFRYYVTKEKGFVTCPSMSDIRIWEKFKVANEPPKDIVVEDFIQHLASQINEWIKREFAGWIPTPDFDTFTQNAEQYKAGKISKEEFYGLFLTKKEDENG